MKIPLYQVDAFASHVFSGNPAAVCPLDSWLPDPLLQAIAEENNLSETAYFVKESDGYRIRWFTPTKEVDLCGHATLASGLILMDLYCPEKREIEFQSKSGPLKVARKGDLFELDFPSQPPAVCNPPDSLLKAFSEKPKEVLVSQDYMLIYENEDQVRYSKPNLDLLREVDKRGVIITAPGKDSDFVSRLFAPKYGIDEDPVTGSTHCALIPYWSDRTGKQKMFARQLSKRGGEIFCEQKVNRVLIAGRGIVYLKGEIRVPNMGEK